MPLDTSIAMSGVQTPLADPMAMYTKGMTLQNLAQQNQVGQMQLDKGQLELGQERTLADLYKNAMNPDGSIDRNKVLAGAANAGLGAKIPGLQKSFLEADTAGATLAGKRADTAKTIQETLYGGLKETDNSISSLLARPDVNENMVMGEMGRLVRVGAFDAQAAHSGKSPDQFAHDLISTMPVGNPQALRGWLTQAGMRVMDASKRLEMTLPKYDLQDRGGTLNEGTIDQLTGQRTAGGAPGQTITPTATPGQVLTNNTTRYGINVADNRARETNDINREAANTQIIEGPQGQVAVNKVTGLARPIANDLGQPLLGKDSTSMKNSQMAARTTGMIPYVKELLKGATASGAGALVDKLNAFTGMATDSGDKAAALETAGGWMTSNVPRFEGPQSDKDTGTYKVMAGQVGDRTLPISTRLKALDTLETLMKTYQVDPTSDRMIYSGPPGTQPATRVAPPAPMGTGPTLAAPRGSAPAGRRAGDARPATPAAAPDINSFFK